MFRFNQLKKYAMIILHVYNLISLWCSSSSDEYKTAMNDIMEAIEQHHKSMKPGEPQLNMCDESIQVRTKYSASCMGMK